MLLSLWPNSPSGTKVKKLNSYIRTLHTPLASKPDTGNPWKNLIFGKKL
jgi:hypothetical protein